MRFIVCTALIALLSAGRAEAVIPPLDNEDRIAMSSHIVEGTVENIAMKTEDDNLGSRHVYTLTVRIVSVLKGENVMAGVAIEVVYWRAGKRPHGWVGDTGQRGAFARGARYRFFLRGGQHDFRLLSPNGYEPVEIPFSYLIHKGESFTLFYPADWEAERMRHNGVTRFTPIEKEGAPPVASNVTVNLLDRGCDAVAAWGERIKRETSKFIDAKIGKPLTSDGGRVLEIAYSWKDEPRQPDRFQNLDRIFCRGDTAYLLRYYSVQMEYDTYLPVARLLSRSFTHRPKAP